MICQQAAAAAMRDSRQLIDNTGMLLLSIITLTLVWEATQGHHIGLSHSTPSVPTQQLTATSNQRQCNANASLHAINGRRCA